MRGVAKKIYGERLEEWESVKLRRAGWSQESLSTGRAPTPGDSQLQQTPLRPKSLRKDIGTQRNRGIQSRKKEDLPQRGFKTQTGLLRDRPSSRALYILDRFLISCPSWFMSSLPEGLGLLSFSRHRILVPWSGNTVCGKRVPLLESGVSQQLTRPWYSIKNDWDLLRTNYSSGTKQGILHIALLIPKNL